MSATDKQVRSTIATLSTWLQAARPLAQFNIALPLLYGQALAWHLHQHFSITWLLLALTFGVLDHLFIVFANDYADRHHDGDATTRTLLSGGSGVLIEGRLTATALKRAAITCACLLSLFAACLSALPAPYTRPWMPLAALVALLLLWAYSYPPCQLSYRGGGELLQGIGIGVVLPWVGYMLPSGHTSLPTLPPLHFLIPTFLIGVAGNLSTALPDHAIDQAGHKRTWAVITSVPFAQATAIVLLSLAALVWAITLSPLLLSPLLLLPLHLRRHTPLQIALVNSTLIALLFMLCFVWLLCAS